MLRSILVGSFFIASSAFAMVPGSKQENDCKEGPKHVLEDAKKLNGVGLADLVTEQSHPKTKNLSSILNKDIEEGLHILSEVDDTVIASLCSFKAQNYHAIVQQIVNTLKNHGRIFFVGSGSSGRIAINLAAQWNKLCQMSGYSALFDCQNKVVGIIAGGLRAFIRAKEGFEDSEDEGSGALSMYKLNAQDTVFLLSASGSAAFNCGAAQAAMRCKATCYHVINVAETISKVEQLFSQGIVPVRIVPGPQAIRGSTRLQAATATHSALGMTLLAVADQLEGKNNTDHIAQQVISGFENACKQIKATIPKIALIVEFIVQALSSPDANFRKVKDETDSGYITYLSMSFLREVITDCVELSPTFSINPTRDCKEIGKKREEFRAFLLDVSSNKAAWQQLCNRELTENECTDTKDMVLGGLNASKEEIFVSRSVGKGNVVFAVMSDVDDKKIFEKALHYAQQNGAKTVVIQLSSALQSNVLKGECDAHIFLGGIAPTFIQGIALKQMLNLISNASMIKMGKVWGNLMIDMSASNKKLLDRAVRIISELCKGQLSAKDVPSYEEIAALVKEVQEKRHSMETKQLLYVPSTVKIVTVMLLKKLSFQDAINHLFFHEEKLDHIFDKEVGNGMGGAVVKEALQVLLPQALIDIIVSYYSSCSILNNKTMGELQS